MKSPLMNLTRRIMSEKESVGVKVTIAVKRKESHTTDIQFICSYL